MIDDLISCEKNLHFPERIYFFPLVEAYYAHCVLCGTDYRVKEDEEDEVAECESDE